jgi:cysteine desulfurase family protein (TIGR01976 family)
MSTDPAPVDLPAVRAQFPALAAAGPHGLPWVHADAPGGTQVAQPVLDAMARYLVTSNANSHGDFPASRATDDLVAAVRARAATFLGGTADGIVFGPNMTSLTFHLSHALDALLAPGDEIVCTRLDHDANVSPWLRLAERTGATVRWVGLDRDGTLATGELGSAVTARTRLVCFPRASNALGTLVDPTPFVDAARAVGALTFMDAVHAAPHVRIDQRAAGVDVVVCSPYKFCGPHAGILSADPALLARLQPDKVRPAPEVGPDRWQTGTASFEAIAGTGAAIDHMEGVGFAAIGDHEAALSTRFLAGVDALPHVHLHGPPHVRERTPTFSVTVDGHAPGDVARHLAADGILAWAGHYYAVEPMRALGLLDAGGAVRVGFVHYHGADDVDRVLQSLQRLG